MKIYIAGKITGDPNYKTKFEQAANEYLRSDVILLPTVLPGRMTPADYMRICFAMIDSADVVAFLPDWQDSPGARLEHDYCEYISKRIEHLEGE